MAQGLGHPIVGDKKYTPSGRGSELPCATRMPGRVFLHCYELGFKPDKTSGQKLTTIKCSLPTELRNVSLGPPCELDLTRGRRLERGMLLCSHH